MVKRRLARLWAVLVALVGGALAQKEIVVGVIENLTGPNAPIGIPRQNTLPLVEERFKGGIAGYRVRFVLLDDRTDATVAAQNARKLVEQERASVLIGSGAVPAALAINQVAVEVGVPFLVTSPALQYPGLGSQYPWAFQIPRAGRDMALVVAKDLRDKGVKRVAYIGFSDAWGDDWYNNLVALSKEYGYEVVANERFARTDTSVTGQVLRILAQRPEAVLIGASSTPAVLPHRTLVERGYKGLIYHTHGVTVTAFLQLGGKVVEGALIPSDPLPVADQLPASFPTKIQALLYKQLYESRYGMDTAATFGAYVFDAGYLLEKAIPQALKRARPEEDLKGFRKALRDALEGLRGVKGASGIFSFSPDRHIGLDASEAVLITVEGGRWKLIRTFR